MSHARLGWGYAILQTRPGNNPPGEWPGVGVGVGVSRGQARTHLSCLLALVDGISQHVGAGHPIAQPHHRCWHHGAEGLPHLIGVAWTEGDI